jgi:NAD(P)-dependent dehydrogenase (short-subunit alcohol dehydrogenase family)
MRLDGKVAIITGAGAGLGRTSALLFASEGAKVVVAEIDGQRAEGAAQAVRDQGGEAIAVKTDVSQEGDVRAAVAGALEHYGKLDVMYANAGVMSFGSIEEVTEEEFRRVIDINLLGVFFCCKHAVPPLKQNGGGAIVITSSAGGLIGFPGTATYAASKGGVNGLVRALAVDLGAYNIRVNSINPTGGMSRNFLLPPGSPLVDEDELYKDWTPEMATTPLVRPTPPRTIDHARVALFLASDESAWCTGLTIPTDGGSLSLVSTAARGRAAASLAR